MSMFLVEHQKAAAKYILDGLKPHGFNIILAGGAVRDWFHDEPANDLDFFIAGEPRPDAIEQVFGIKPTPLAEETYQDPSFEGFEFEVEGHKCQFLFHKCDDPKKHVEDTFPVSSSECWWDGEEWWYSRNFSIGERYNALIFEERRIKNWHYVDKIAARNREKQFYFSMNEFLRRHFQEPPAAVRREPLDLEGFAVGAMFFGEEPDPAAL